MKSVGVKAIDEQLKVAFGMVHELAGMRKAVEKAILELADECSLPESANMAQCLRIITLRLASCATVTNFKVVRSLGSFGGVGSGSSGGGGIGGYPHLKVVGELTPKLQRTMVTLDRALAEFCAVCTAANDLAGSVSAKCSSFGGVLEVFDLD